MPAEERLKVVLQGRVDGRNEPGNVARSVQPEERRPPGDDYVNHGEQSVLRGVDEQITREVVGAVVVQKQLMVPDLHPVARLGNRLGRHRPPRVVYLAQHRGRVRVRDDGGGGREQMGGTDMVDVRVAVDHVGDRLAGDLRNRREDLLAERRRGVDGRDAPAADQEQGLVDTVADAIEPVPQLIE